MSENKKWIEAAADIKVIPNEIKGVPTYVFAEKNMGMMTGHDADSQFIAAELKAEDGREFGIMLHLMFMNPQKGPDSAYPMGISIISMTDFTNNTYCAKEDSFMLPNFTYGGGDTMNIETPVSYMRGDKAYVEMGADLPDGAGHIELSMIQEGPVLYNCSTGKFLLIADQGESAQFSLPHLKATGTLKTGDKELEVTGIAWMDRQWADACPDFYNRNIKWKWMNLQLNNGYRISLWDFAVGGKKENAWATILSPKGAHMVVDMKPMGEGETEFFTGKTGQIYPTKWHIEFPSIDSYFDVQVRGPVEQEIISPMGEDKYEAACTFTGKFLGEDVYGTNYVELVGSFK